ncbi:hypothetical protein [Haloarcula laminariae]|uniref:hypothetical protein n=1 Tax=Haloarcula laminariae TaxID=2961577 RepID=UPI002405475F|nr:hypothetical protein [Halomicroarcula sp. FL173]
MARISLEDAPDSVLKEIARQLNSGEPGENVTAMEQSGHVGIVWEIPEGKDCETYETLRSPPPADGNQCDFEATKDEIKSEIQRRDWSIDCDW